MSRNSRRYFWRVLRRMAYVFVAFMLAMFTIGIVSAASSHPTAPTAPAECRLPDGSLLPSGDAALIDGHTFVCTDGVWVKVTNYGN